VTIAAANQLIRSTTVHLLAVLLQTGQLLQPIGVPVLCHHAAGPASLRGDGSHRRCLVRAVQRAGSDPQLRRRS
jgi:hypothetical protein